MKRIVSATLAASLLLGSPLVRADANEDKAKALYKSGVDHYKKKDYKAAVRDLKAADDLYPSPALAFNIAQAYRQMGDCRDALTWYRNYLDRDPGAANKAQVNERIGEMLRCLPKGEEPPPPVAAPPPPPPPPAPEPTPEPTPEAKPPEPAPLPTPPVEAPPPAPTRVVLPPPPTDQDPGRGKRIAGLALLGGGVAVTAVGVIFGLAARSNADDVSQLSKTGGQWSSAFADKQSAGQRDETIGAFGIGLGAAAIVGGGILYYLGATQKVERPAVSVGVRSGGGDLVVSWHY